MDPTAGMQELMDQCKDFNNVSKRFGDGITSITGKQDMIQEFAFSLPGVDEAMSFAEVMKLVKSMDYSCKKISYCKVLFLILRQQVQIGLIQSKGHTLRFLSFPTVLGISC